MFGWTAQNLTIICFLTEQVPMHWERIARAADALRRHPCPTYPDVERKKTGWGIAANAVRRYAQAHTPIPPVELGMGVAWDGGGKELGMGGPYHHELSRTPAPFHPMPMPSPHSGPVCPRSP